MELDLSNAWMWDIPLKAQIISQRYIDHAHEYIFNSELNIYVHPETGHCINWMIEWDKNGNKYYRQWTEIRWHNNGKDYMVANVGKWWKYRSLLHHKVVYATLNKLPYKWDYTVLHIDEDTKNNTPSNLYIIHGTGGSKWSIENKQRAYKLLELYNHWLLFDSEWKKICI